MWSVAQDELRGWWGEGVDGRTSTQMATGNWNHWKVERISFGLFRSESSKCQVPLCFLFFQGEPVGYRECRKWGWQDDIEMARGQQQRKKNMCSVSSMHQSQKNRKHLVFFRNQLGITVGSPESMKSRLQFHSQCLRERSSGMAKVPCDGEGRALLN